MAILQDLPTEIIDMIVAALDSNKNSLCSLCRVSRDFDAIFRSHVQHTITLKTPTDDRENCDWRDHSQPLAGLSCSPADHSSSALASSKARKSCRQSDHRRFRNRLDSGLVQSLDRILVRGQSSSPLCRFYSRRCLHYPSHAQIEDSTISHEPERRQGSCV